MMKLPEIPSSIPPKFLRKPMFSQSRPPQAAALGSYSAKNFMQWISVLWTFFQKNAEIFWRKGKRSYLCTRFRPRG